MNLQTNSMPIEKQLIKLQLITRKSTESIIIIYQYASNYTVAILYKIILFIW